MKNLLRKYGRSTTYLLVTDWLILIGSFSVALHFRRYAPGLNIISLQLLHIAVEASFVFVYSLAMLGIFTMLNFYKRKTLLSTVWHFLRIVQGVTVCILGYLLIKILTKSDLLVPSRFVIINWGILLFVALSLHRLIILPIIVKIVSRVQPRRRVIIIGVSENSARIAQQILEQKRYATLNPIGFLSNNRKPGILITDDLACLGPINSLPELVNTHEIEGAIITQTDISYQDLMDLIERCVRFFGWVDVHTDKSAVWHNNLNTDTYFDIPFVRLREIPTGPMIRAYKETTDKLGAAIGLLLLSPLLIATVIAIKLTSPGPIFYTRDRVGKNGKLFTFYKFRSMYTGADQDKTRNADIKEYLESGDQISRKTINISQVTPVGKFIRKWAIDELPQLINVLKGDMSLIGPRPVPLNEYEITDEWHKRRFEIKPGCAGLWKIYASRDGVSFNDTVLYDIYYARNMSPMIDLYIVAMTIWVILTGRADG